MRLSFEDARKLNIDEDIIRRAQEHAASAERSEAVREHLEVEPPKPKRAKAADGMNKTERRFSEVLDCMVDDYEIQRWDFEPEKFRLADRTWLKPDFRITLHSGMNVFVEVKVARADGSVLWTDDGAVKIKTVPELHPYPFFLAVYGDRRWTITRLPSRNYGWIHVDIDWRL
jgi:hypothetical protein